MEAESRPGDRNQTSCALMSTYTDSYLPWRFWREGWIANKTLQKLAVQVLESELVLTCLCKAVRQ